MPKRKEKKIEMRKIRSDSAKQKVLDLMFMLNCAYLVDIKRFITCNANNRQGVANPIINSLIDDGLCEVREYEDVKDPVLHMTPVGKTYMLEHFPQYQEYISEFDRQERVFLSTNIDRVIVPNLSINKCVVSFYTVEVPCLISQKPDLLELISGIKSKDTAILELFNSGVYYTSHEYKKAFPSDTYSSSRFRGIFISNYTCYVVYDTTINNKRHQLNNLVENRLLEHIETIFKPISQIYRYLPLVNKERGRPYALVFTVGTKTIDEMITGLKNGSVNEVKEKRMNLPIVKNKMTSLLGINFEEYSRIFAIPLSYFGITSLFYLTSHTVESYIADMHRMLSNSKDFTKDTAQTIMPYFKNINHVTGKHLTRVAFIPAYEVNFIASLTDGETIITYADMVKTIAHGTRSTHEYLDGNTLSPFPRHTTYDFARNGYPLGVDMIIKELSARNYNYTLVFPSAMRVQFAHDRGFDNPCEFYNKIGMGEINLIDVVKELIHGKAPTGAYAPPRRKRRVKLTVLVDTDLRKEIEKEANTRQMSMNSVVTEVLYHYFFGN